MKFKCKGCGKVLSGCDADSGTSSDCPACGKVLKIPHPGIGIGAFWGYWFLIKFFGALLLVGMEDAGVLLFPVVIAFNLHAKYLRAINIGLHPAWTLFGLVPVISTIWFGVAGPGSRKKRPVQ